MKKIKILSITLLVCVFNYAYSLSTDSEQDIEIEADTAEMDDIKRVTTYRGNVIVIQGSIKMHGDIMTVYFDENNDMELVVMNGEPATYRQLPDNSNIYDEAEALQMEYYALKNYVILINEAIVTQEGLKFSGKRIEYDTVLSKVKAEGEPDISKKENEKEKDGRVKIIIKKKKEQD